MARSRFMTSVVLHSSSLDVERKYFALAAIIL